MKKDITGHMTAQKEPFGSRWRRWNMGPRLICLLLAILIWLAVVNLSPTAEAEGDTEPQMTANETGTQYD